MIAMLALALRYLVVAVVVGAGFAMLQGGDSRERTTTARAPKPSMASATSVRPTSGSEESDETEASDESEESYEGDESDESYENEESEESQESESWEYVVAAGSHGHFVIEAVVDGVPLTFLLDTGASDIVLTLDDARQLGFLPQTLEFSQRFRTANGEVRGAPVRLRELRIGQFSLYNLDASVNEAPLAISLLGMRFLDRLNGYQVEDGRLILRW
jgi:clan AA aspartic protease (TIGR02281 family)